MNLMDYFESHYSPLRLRGKSQETRRLYRYSIRSFSRTIGRDAVLDDLTDINLSRHMQRVVDAGRAAATANKDRAQISAIWRFAARHKMVATWPEVHPEIEPERTPTAWLPDELDALLRACNALSGNIGGVPRRLWWSSLVRLTLDCGERIGATRSAQWNWIRGKHISIPAEVRKGKRRDRVYMISDTTIRYLLELKAVSKTKECFPFPYAPSHIWGKYKEVLRSAGLPCGRQHAFHALRRSAASIIEASGMDAQKALDHSDRRTTDKYIDPRYIVKHETCNILEAYLSLEVRRKKPQKKDSA